jgi:hypothetical protein
MIYSIANRKNNYGLSPENPLRLNSVSASLCLLEQLVTLYEIYFDLRIIICMYTYYVVTELELCQQQSKVS